MCGIVGLHLRDPRLYPRLGWMLSAMIGQVVERGPDSAGVALYGDDSPSVLGRSDVSVLGRSDRSVLRRSDPSVLGRSDVSVLGRSDPSVLGQSDVSVLGQPQWAVPGQMTVSLLVEGVVADDLSARVSDALRAPATIRTAAGALTISADVDAATLIAATTAALPGALVIGHGSGFAVLKGVGNPLALTEQLDLAHVQGWQAVAHTRMATESAVSPAGAHPFSVGEGQCLVHNGSFANHATIRRELKAQGVHFDTDNDSEVGARFVAQQLASGADVDKALRLLCERFDGFYTLLVTTSDSFAVVRDAIACKPAIIAETAQWVAMASEYRALAALPGIETATIFEPEPERVYSWQR